MLSKDGVLVLQHDTTVDRCVSGYTGSISDYTWAQLKAMPVKDGLGGSSAAVYKITAAQATILNSLPNYKIHVGTAAANQTIPMARFDDVLDLLKKYGPDTMLTLDKTNKPGVFAECYRLLREKGMLDRAIYKISTSVSALNGWIDTTVQTWNTAHPEEPVTADEVRSSILCIHVTGNTDTKILQQHMDNGPYLKGYVAPGAADAYYGTAPTKVSNANSHFVFKDWNAAITGIQADTTVTAQYTAVPHRYVSSTEEAVYICADCGYRSASCGHTTNYAWDVDGDDTLEILAIGNSFSDDALEYACDIAHSLGIKNVVVANLYIGGCSLNTHATNAAGDLAKYSYRMNNNGTRTTTANYKISTALTERSWDYISLQQSSGSSGLESTYNQDLTNLIHYVRTVTSSTDNPNRNICTKLVWHMTWAYQQNSTHASFPNYNSDQMTMYNSILSAVQNKIVPTGEFDLIIPSGTAVQNARSSLIGDTLTRDGYHMSIPYGRYLTGLTFIKTITGLSIDSISYRTAGISELYQKIAIEAVNNALKQPFAVTQSSFTGEAPAEGYLLLNPQLAKCGFWNATDEKNYNRIITTAYNSNYFYATVRFTKEDLPVGSIILLENGWQYRPEGWISDTVQPSRPGTVKPAYVLVTEEWWGDYTIRAFNISKVGLPSLETVTEAEIRAAFRIYVPEGTHSHSYTSTTIPATCINAGSATYNCPICGHSYTSSISAKGHSWNSGAITTQPTCTATGVKTYSCTACGEKKTETVAAKGHTAVTDKAVAATCTTPGKTEGRHCTVCNTVLIAQQTIPAAGHRTSYVSVNELQHKLYCTACSYNILQDHTLEGGRCICGEALREPLLNESLQIYHSLNLANDISVNYVIPKSSLEGIDMESVYVQVETEEYNGNVPSGTTTCTLYPVEDGNYYYFTLSGLSAVQMNNELRACLYWQQGSQPYYSETDLYSIGSYAYSQLNKASATVELKTLCAELLRYGAKSQLYKGYRTDALVDEAVEEVLKAFLSDLEDVSFGNTNEVIPELEQPPVAWLGKSLDLGTRVTVNLVVDLTNYFGAVEDLRLTVRYETISGETVTKSLTEGAPYAGNGKYYCFTFDSLLAAELRTPLSVSVYAGKDLVSDRLNFSPDTYGNGKTGALGEVCKALFAYSDSARDYFLANSQ